MKKPNLDQTYNPETKKPNLEQTLNPDQDQEKKPHLDLSVIIFKLIIQNWFLIFSLHHKYNKH